MGIFKRADSPHWWYKIQLEGRVFTGTTNTPDKRLAHKIYLEKHHQFVEEHHLPSQRGRRISLFKMCEEYMEKHAKINKRSWKDDSIIVKKLKEHFGDIPLINVQPQTIEGYKAARMADVKESTINRELAVLKTIFTKAIQWGYAYRNPVKEVRLFKEEMVPIRILTADERQKLLAASPDFLRPIILMALKTGMRQGEIFNLKWKEVDLAQGTISVTHTKSKKLRQIPIHPELAEALRVLPSKSAYVFGDNAGNKRNPEGMIRATFEKITDDLGLSDLTFHGLRHNFASELVSKGADLRTVQEYLGHSSLRMVQRYAHVSKGTWRSTIQLLGRDTPQTSATLTLRSNFQEVKTGSKNLQSTT